MHPVPIRIDEVRAYLLVGIGKHSHGGGCINIPIENTSDVGVIRKALDGGSADADECHFVKRAARACADMHATVILGSNEVLNGRGTANCVLCAVCVVKHCAAAHGYITRGVYVVDQCIVTHRYVFTAGSVIQQRINTHGLVKTTGRVTEQRLTTDGVV